MDYIAHIVRDYPALAVVFAGAVMLLSVVSSVGDWSDPGDGGE